RPDLHSFPTRRSSDLAAIPGYTVAGKTGTGSIPGPHGYADSLGYMASFVGMVPASDPRLVVLVVVDRPRGAIFGGVVAAPAFQRSEEHTSELQSLAYL